MASEAEPSSEAVLELVRLIGELSNQDLLDEADLVCVLSSSNGFQSRDNRPSSIYVQLSIASTTTLTTLPE